MLCRFAAVSLAVVALSSPLDAQLTTPSHWRWITDAPAELVTGQDVPDSAWRFVTMPPGWHVTTGPGAILFDPTVRAQGRFGIEAEVFLFPDSENGEFGLFFGGTELDGSQRRYSAFVLRRDGMAAVYVQDGATRRSIVPWTVSDAVKPHPGSGTLKHVLGIDVEPRAVTFRVNGETVVTVPRDRLPAEGAIGFRAGANVNLHWSTLDVTFRLAEPRPQR